MELKKDGDSVVYCFTIKETDVLRAIFVYIIQDIDSEDQTAEEVMPQPGSTMFTLANTAVGDYVLILALKEENGEDEAGEEIEETSPGNADPPTFSLMNELRKFSKETSSAVRKLRREGEYANFYEPYVAQRKALGMGAQLLLEEIAAETARFTVENDGVPPPEYFLS